MPCYPRLLILTASLAGLVFGWTLPCQPLAQAEIIISAVARTPVPRGPMDKLGASFVRFEIRRSLLGDSGLLREEAARSISTGP